MGDTKPPGKWRKLTVEFPGVRGSQNSGGKPLVLCQHRSPRTPCGARRPIRPAWEEQSEVVVPTWIEMAIPSSRSPSLARRSFAARLHDADRPRRLAERCGGGAQQLQHIEHPCDVVIPDPIRAATAATQLLAQGGDEAVKPAPVYTGGREQRIE